MDKKQAIAIEIALQTHVLKTCPTHRQIYFDDDADTASAFALAIELVRKHKLYVDEFHDDEHALTDLLSECQSAGVLGSARDRNGFVESALEIR